jgi:hypothetical protein
MKIAIVLSQSYYYFPYDRVARLLCSWGHDVKIICRSGFSEDGNKSARALLELVKKNPNASLEYALFRDKSAQLFPSIIRELANYAVFVRDEHPSPHLALGRAKLKLPGKIVKFIQNPLIRFLLSTKLARFMLMLIESLIPPDEQIVEWLKVNQPQVIFASPFIYDFDLEIEYVKAARHLSIPVIASVWSWDNLTSKGTYQVRPNWLFVWNQNLHKEAVEIHDFSEEQVFITGAPVYDSWLELKPSTDREAFCRQAGVNPSKPYILYLCSSKQISENEAEIIRELVSYIEKMAVENRPSVIIRPHPSKDIDLNDIENEWIRVFPKQGQRPDIDRTRQTYFDTLYYSALVIGINTTGFLESALLDKPCLTLANPATSEGQEMRAHFKHLMDAEFIEVATSFPELIDKIEKILVGDDDKRDNRQKFVRQFIRPKGIGISPSLVMAKAIIAVGKENNPNKWQEYGNEI